MFGALQVDLEVQGGEGQGGDPEASRAQPGGAGRERRDQLPPLGELRGPWSSAAARPARGRPPTRAPRGDLPRWRTAAACGSASTRSTATRTPTTAAGRRATTSARPPPSRRAKVRRATLASTSSPPTSMKGWPGSWRVPPPSRRRHQRPRLPRLHAAPGRPGTRRHAAAQRLAHQPRGPAPAGRRLPAVDDRDAGSPATLVVTNNGFSKPTLTVVDYRAVGRSCRACRACVARPGPGRRRQGFHRPARREHRPRLRLRLGAS